jgi:hypothetical protein
LFVLGVAARIHLLALGFVARARFLTLLCMKVKGSQVAYSAQAVSSTGFQAQAKERKSVNSIRTEDKFLTRSPHR